MAKFFKTALSNFSSLFQTNDNNTTINTNAYTIPPMHQENNENINNDDTIDFDSLFGSTENITTTDDKDSNNSDESKSITPKEVGATIAVGTTSILSGVAKINEYIDDGVTWAEGKVVEGVSWLVGETAGLFSEDTKDSIMDWREDVKEDIKNEIDRDKVGELNEWFYENTKIGKSINETSYLKYDSEAAKTTQNITTKIGEIGGATALTILTGGAAAPLVFSVGCAEGIGKTAEKTYQNGGDFDDGTFSILLSGGLNGMSWVANGKLVQGAFEIIKDAASVGLLETGSTLLNDTLLNKEFWSNTIKNGLSLKTMSSSGNSVINVNALMNYGSSLMSIGGDFVDVLNSDEGFTPKNIMSLGKKYLVALGLNVLEDSGREYLSAYKSGNIISTPSTETFKNSNYKTDDDTNLKFQDDIQSSQMKSTEFKETPSIKSIIDDIDLENTSFRDQLQIVSKDGPSFKLYLNRLNNLDSDQLPHGFSSVIDYKKYAISSMLSLDTSENLKLIDNFVTYEIAKDKDLAYMLNGTSYLETLVKFNIKGFNLKSVFENYTYQELNDLMNSESISTVIKEMSVDDFCNLIGRYNNFEGNPILATDSIVNKFLNLTDSEIIEFINNPKYLGDSFIKSINQNYSTEKSEKFANEFINKYLDETKLLSNQKYYKKILEIVPYSRTNSPIIYDKMKDLKDKLKNVVNKKVISQIPASFLDDYVLDIDSKYSDMAYLKLKNSNYSYFNIKYSLDDTLYDELLSLEEISKKLDLRLSNKIIDIYKGNFKLLSIEPNEIRSTLNIANVEKGVNRIVLDIDGKEVTKVVNQTSEYSINLNQGFFSKNEIENMQSVLIKEIINLGNFNQPSVTSGLYKVNVEAAENTTSFYISGDDDFLLPGLRINEEIVSRNISDFDNVSIEKIDEIPSLKKYIDYGKNQKIFKSDIYGGNQSDVYELINSRNEGEKLSDVNQKKADRLSSIIKKYFPNVSDKQEVSIAENYTNCGCEYMAVANAFASYIDENKLYDKFSECFGYDLFNDGICNYESIAFEAYLKSVSDTYGDDIETLLKKSNGVSQISFNSIFDDFFKEKGFNINTTASELKNPESLASQILNNQGEYHVLEASNFDMEQISTNYLENEIIDGALKNAIIDGNKKENVGGHAMIITDFDDNNNIFVSSWSRKYQFLPDSLKKNNGNARVRSIKFDIIGGE